MRDSNTEEFESFLAAHATLPQDASFADGACIGEWRIVAFLGKGGSGEVYRVVRKRTGGGSAGGMDEANETEVAALKVLVKDGAAARARFQREIDLLSKNWHAAFPRFFGAGEVEWSPRDRRDGHVDTLYYAMELLSPVEMPSVEDDVANYILAVSRAVAILHCSGLVHRDIKPQNIMQRANGELVLIDLGLVKASSASSSSGTSVTLVDGKVVGAGTPRYAAPEQFNGGAVSPATDIHALGMLANECFAGCPPRAWKRIISRATSSIPSLRYSDVAAFTRAIRHRHDGRIATGCGIGAALVVIVLAIVFGRATSMRSPLSPSSPTWKSLACDLQTNIVERQLLYEKFTTNDAGRVMLSKRVWRNVTNDVAGTVIRLNNQRHSFTTPMLLETNRVYWIVGPGTLDVSLDGRPGSKVCLDNCVDQSYDQFGHGLWHSLYFPQGCLSQLHQLGS